MTLNEFIKSAGLTMRTEPADHNPHMPDSDDMDHWRCTIRAGRASMTIIFSMGKGHSGVRPALPDVLDCLASDSYSLPLPEMAGSEDTAFAEWCGEYGYDTDSRRALATYRTVLRQSRALRRLLGPSAFNTLLSDVDRL